MLKLAVYHPDKLLRKKISNYLIEILRKNNIYGKVYSVQNFQKLYESIEDGRHQFDIFCLETSHESCEQLMGKYRHTEFILVDTPIELLSIFMRYKPVGWIQSTDSGLKKLPESLKACIYYLKVKSEECFCIHTKTRSLRIPYRQIQYFESRLHQIVIHTRLKENLFVFSGVLDDIEKLLPSGMFFRCHQSFLVRIDTIHQLDRTNRNLILDNGEILGISKRYYKEIDRIFAEDTVIQ